MRGIDNAVRSIVIRQNSEGMGMIGHQCNKSVVNAHFTVVIATFPRLKHASLDIEQAFIDGKISAIYKFRDSVCSCTLVQPRSQTLTG